MLKKIFAFSFFALMLFAVSNNLKAQTLYFCESVTSDGYPQTESTVFNIGSGGGYLDILVKLPYELNCRSVRYEIYKVDSYGSETYNTTISQDTERNWIWFYKQVTFYDSGKYNVYVYDCNDALLTSGSVKIQFN
jgi:hypothetical protein